MQISNRVFTGLFFTVASLVAAPQIQAKPSSWDSDCLSNPELNAFSKDALVELQAIDPLISLTEVKTYVKSLGSCITLDVANAAIEELAASLQPTTNSAPIISGVPSSTVAENEQYLFSPSVYDVDNDPLIFSIENRPEWADFDPQTGLLTGDPDFESAGNYSNIIISVTDGTDTVSLPSFSIEVLNTNRSPSISGMADNAVIVGDDYLFRPNGSDPDGDTLKYSVENLPAWMSFNATDGSISGTPAAEDEGVYADIIIKVSDGEAIASLDAIMLSVNLDSTGTVSLSWSAPTTRSDMSDLPPEEIAGYRIYMGSTSDKLDLFMDINDGASTSYTISDLPVGTYFFSITVYDVYDAESTYSEIVNKSI